VGGFVSIPGKLSRLQLKVGNFSQTELMS
jgi:hypothetical protein